GMPMLAASVRGLICHTAREAGFDPGPDYSFGWGLADGLTAAEHITNNGSSTLMEETTIETGSVYTKTFAITNVQELRATICWTDPVGTPNGGASVDNRSPRLKNDLDIRIYKDGETFYPWSLDPEDPAAPATNFGDNNRDNIERIDIEWAQ